MKRIKLLSSAGRVATVEIEAEPCNPPSRMWGELESIAHPGLVHQSTLAHVG